MSEWGGGGGEGRGVQRTKPNSAPSAWGFIYLFIYLFNGFTGIMSKESEGKSKGSSTRQVLWKSAVRMSLLVQILLVTQLCSMSVNY